VLVVVNSHTDARPISVIQGQFGFQYTMPAQSVATFVWNLEPGWLRPVLHWWERVRAAGRARASRR
jgi:glucosylceramidase